MRVQCNNNNEIPPELCNPMQINDHFISVFENNNHNNCTDSIEYYQNNTFNNNDSSFQFQLVATAEVTSIINELKSNAVMALIYICLNFVCPLLINT